MKLIYRAVAGLLCFAAMFCLLSCADNKSKVGLFLYNQEDLFVEKFTRQIIKMGEEHMALDTFNAQNSQILQNEHIAARITAGSDLMVINPVDRLGAYSIIRKLKDENIPVIFFNREPLYKDLVIWDRIWYVGARAEQSGQMQARLVMELFGGDPDKLNRFDRNGDGRIQTIILKGEQGHQDAEIRSTEVVRSFRLEGFDLDILVTEVANWDRDEAYEKMGSLLDDYGEEMELVLSNNDAMALGAIARMRQRGFFKDDNGNGAVDKGDGSWIPVLGIDGLDQAVVQIREGYLYGTVINDSEEQARAMTDLAEAVLSGEDLSALSYEIEKNKYIWIDYKPFTLENTP